MLSQNISQGKLINELKNKLDEVVFAINGNPTNVEYQLIINRDINLAKADVDTLLPFGWVIDHFTSEGKPDKGRHVFLMKRIIP